MVQNERRYGKSEFHFTSSQSISYDIVEATATFIRQRIAQDPTLGIICGSGLGKKELTICPDSPIYKTFFLMKDVVHFSAQLANLVENPIELKYEDIPNFPKSTAPGHKSRLLSGTLNGVSVILLQGRFHLYEGYSIHKVGTYCN